MTFLFLSQVCQTLENERVSNLQLHHRILCRKWEFLYTLITFIIITTITTIIGALTLMCTAIAEPAPPAELRVAFVTPATRQTALDDKAVLFYDDFAAPPDRPARYFEYNPENGSFVWKAYEGMGTNRGAMKAQFEKGQVEAGGLKLLFGENPFSKGIRPHDTFREIYWRVYVKHEAGWIGNPAKLARATCLASTDWSQGFIAHVWGGKGEALCIDPATGIQDSRKVTLKYNDFDHLHWLGSRETQTPIFSPAESGRWVCIESHIRLNSPNRNDGIFELRIDGQLEAARTNLDWHGAWDDYAIDAVFLENYWNDGAIKREARWFTDFVVSTRPVGPILASSPPTLSRTKVADIATWQAEVATNADGMDITWSSLPVQGKMMSLTIDAAHGTFTGSRKGQQSLTPGATHWLRLRQRSDSGAWSAWSAWHAPFQTE
jgi:hypothetical protein